MLKPALAGVDALLSISSSEIGQRVAQHHNVIEAAKAAGVRRIVYTSFFHADVSPISLAVEHRETEAELKASGIPHTILRNGWYTEESYLLDRRRPHRSSLPARCAAPEIDIVAPRGSGLR